jgi:ferrous iron transport protein B
MKPVVPSASSLSSSLNPDSAMHKQGEIYNTLEASCRHSTSDAIRQPAFEATAFTNGEVKTLALAGNPNVGKSVFFNALTGAYVEVSNFPGTTVGISKGKLQKPPSLDVWDTPGVYGLTRLSEEEVVAEQALMQADIILNVVNAVTLDRDLFLTQQLIDYGRPMIVAVNQMDEARERGLTLDLAALENQLQVPVIACTATEGKGIQEVLTALYSACYGRRTPELPLPEQLVQLEADKAQQLRVYGHRRLYLKSILPHITQRPQEGSSQPLFQRISRTIGRALLRPVVGGMALIVALLALYQIIGVWVAGDAVDLLEGKLMLTYVIPWIETQLKHVVAPNTPWWTILAGEYGLLTMTPRYLIGVLAPLVIGFNLYLSILEDSGYLPRLATLSDSVMQRVGLNGRAIIPMILGLGCVTMATISTRVLSSQRERTIATTLLAITIPCSAQLGLIMGMMALAGGVKGWLLYICILTILFMGIGTVLNRIMPGMSSGLVIDLPPMRFPRWQNVLKKTWVRSWSFIVEATPLFAIGALAVSLAEISGLLLWVQNALGGVTQTLLHLPKESASAFIMGMVRRDFGLAGFYTLKDVITPIQMLTSLVVITLFVPCVATATVMLKERGWREGTSVFILSWVMAFATGAVVTRLLEWVNFTI